MNEEEKASVVEDAKLLVDTQERVYYNEVRKERTWPKTRRRNTVVGKSLKKSHFLRLRAKRAIFKINFFEFRAKTYRCILFNFGTFRAHALLSARFAESTLY